MWVEFVVVSCPCSEGFSPGSPVFLPPQKPTFPNSKSTWKQWTKSLSVDVPPKFPFIYLFNYGKTRSVLKKPFNIVSEKHFTCLWCPRVHPQASE